MSKITQAVGAPLERRVRPQLRMLAGSDGYYLQPRAKRLHRQPDAVTGLRLHPRAHKEAHSAKSRKTKRAFAARRCALPCECRWAGQYAEQSESRP